MKYAFILLMRSCK